MKKMNTRVNHYEGFKLPLQEGVQQPLTIELEDEVNCNSAFMVRVLPKIATIIYQ